VTDLQQHVDESIAARKLFRRGQKLLVAVSGGVDSMVLLHVLHALSQKYRWQLTVAHLNHSLRGRSSDADERLVARAAKKLGVPVVTERVDVKKFARTGKLSIEMAARKLRHEFLARTAARLKIPGIALGHHADDQVELFFLRLLRGSGGEGLAGMKWQTPSPANANVELVRPLLDTTKSALLEFVRVKRLPFREDASNAWLDIRRNRIRHQLLPLLRRNYQLAVDEIILRLGEILRAEGEFVTGCAEAWLKKPTPFRDLPLALQRRVLQMQLSQRKIAGDFELIEKLRLRPNSAISVSPEIAVARDTAGRLILHGAKIALPGSRQLRVKLINRSGEIRFGDTDIAWEIVRGKRSRIPGRRNGEESFDAEKVGPRIILRHWRPGDRFQPIGMPAPVKLQNLFTNQKIPRGLRHRLVVATTVGGELFWVENLRMAERFKLSNTTVYRLNWRWRRS
jgi:tRNA(Ile)-lysidine synthase